MPASIELKGVCKKYRKFTALDDFSFSAETGRITGLIGPNGAGKTTMIRSVLGLTSIDSGTIAINGQTDRKALSDLRRNIGTLIEYPTFFGSLNAVENLRINQKMKGMNNTDEIYRILDLVGLNEVDRKKKVSGFSLGMKQRLGLAKALIADPDILILDEPTNGLDPKGIVELREFILELKNKGKTIILCSHILSEMEQLASNITFINKGKQIKSITSGELSTEFGKKIEIVTNETEKISNFLRERFSEASIKQENNSVLLSAVDIQFMELFDLFKKNNISVNGITEKNISLEDYFMEIVK
ncbi:MAG: ABC transporter ATP-binding protein [Ruminococcus sp.]|nr:ABC transporter ATP-binding protein [Ruminococcus sp.]